MSDQILNLHVPVKEIYSDPTFNCRGIMDVSRLLELADSIKLHGLLSPILIQPRNDLPEPYKYRIIAGHRRFEACVKFLHQLDIKALIDDSNLSDEEIRFLNLVENINRQDLTTLETAYALNSFIANGYSPKELSKKIHHSVSWIKTQLNILKLTPMVQELVLKGKLTSDAIDLLSTIPFEKQDEAVQKLLPKLGVVREGRKNRVKRRPKSEFIEMATYARRNKCKLISKALHWALGEIESDVLKKDILNAARKNVPE